MVNRAILFSIAGAVACVHATTAAAQTTEFLNGVTSADVAGLFREAGMKAVEVPPAGDSSVRAVRVDLTEKSTFYVILAVCASADPSAACALVSPYAMFKSSGVTLATTNLYNREKTRVSTLILEDNGDIMLRAKFAVPHGVTRKNLAFNISLFLNDISGAIEAMQAGSSANTVAWRRAATDAFAGSLKAAGGGDDLEAPAPQWVGAKTQKVDPAVIERLKHIGDAPAEAR